MNIVKRMSVMPYLHMAATAFLNNSDILTLFIVSFENDIDIVDIINSYFLTKIFKVNNSKLLLSH